MVHNIELIGALAKYEGEMLERGRSVFINGNREIQYTLELLMDCPEEVRKEKYYTGYGRQLEAYGMSEEYGKDYEERIGDFTDILEDYLVIFNPVENGSFMNIDSVALTIKPSAYEKGMSFVTMPFYETKEELKVFIQRLTHSRRLSVVTGIEETRTLPYFLWKKKGVEEVYCIACGEKILSYRGEYVLGNRPIEMHKLTEAQSRLLILNPRNEDESIAFVEKGVDEALRLLRQQAAFKEYAEEVAVAAVKPITYPMTSMAGVASEKQFLETFYHLIRSEGFSYSQKDLMNFHTAMKTGSLVILSGMSGTGKSRLVDFYRRALGLNKKQYKSVSVRSSWTDEADLLGYADMMNKVYRPDHEGVVDLIIHAANHPKELHLICFDEMNLAKVEHYFSQFLSLLEMDEKERVLKLYNPAINLDNSEVYPAEVKLLGNILFVGTVNMDESTNHFSDKVLDRANVIELERVSLGELQALEASDRAYEMNVNAISYEDFLEMGVKNRKLGLMALEMECLEEVHQLLSGAHKNLGIGYRIAKQIDDYLANLPKDQDVLTREVAFDLQFAQRILSKLRGDMGILEHVLLRGREEEGTLAQLLGQYSSLSSFELSQKMIKQKARELMHYGYTL